MNAPHPALGIALVSGIALVAWTSLAWMQRRGWFGAETARKLLHVSTGLLALSFPWLFTAIWPPVVIVGGSFLLLLAARFLPRARSTLGPVLHGVERASWGEFYLPFSIAFVWVLSFGNTILYLLPILLVTFADAVAALIGVRYGQHQYIAQDGQKSLEGSVAFLVVAFLCVHVPLLLLTSTGRSESLLIAVILGFLVMLLEGMSWRGLDNLLIPIVGFLLLQSLLPFPLPTLLLHVMVLAAVGMTVLIWRKGTTLQGGALLGAVLIGYLFWTLGDWRWVIAPLTVFAAYSWLPPRIDLDGKPTHGAQILLWVCSASLVWLAASRLELLDSALAAATFAFAAHLGITCAIRLHYARPSMPHALIVAIAAAEASVLLLVPYGFVVGWNWATAAVVAVGIVTTVLATGIFQILRLNVPDPLPAGFRWMREAVTAAVVSVGGFVAIRGLHV